MSKEPQSNDQTPKKKRHLGFLIAVIICALLVAVLLILNNMFKIKIPVNPATLDPSAPEGETQMQELSVSDLLKAVMTVKDDLEEAGEDMLAGNLELAKLKVDGITKKTYSIRASLDLTIEAMGDSMPSLTKELVNVQQVLDLVDLAAEKLLHPTIRQLSDHPITELHVGEGFNTGIICNYITYLETLMPDIELLIQQAGKVDLSVVDSDGDIQEYLESANELLSFYHDEPESLSMLRNALGGNGDKFYLIAPQNSAEIRASGGFPGSIGTLEITNGILTVGDFKRVYDVLHPHTPAEANITQIENTLFLNAMSAPRDADYCPDFERVGYIFALGYEYRMQQNVDGVISMTPSILQKVLAALDQEITLFDGMVLNGDNATKALQHDLYYNYFGPEYVYNAKTITDQLFADAAKKTMQTLMENLEPENLMAYLEIAKNAFADRTLMLWSKDEQQQAMLRKLGWHAGLTTDPENPVAGIYYSVSHASKMGWFLVVDIDVGEPSKNADGSCTYPITVTFTNAMTPEELHSVHSYISGNGGFTGNAYFFAPAGGTVSNFTASNNVLVQKHVYHDLDLGYLPALYLATEKSITVTYDLTTAPGVDAPLTISKTPTVQEYH